MINIENLSFNYHKKRALKGINVQFNQGFNVLLGSNGAGKSTLIALLTHLLKPSTGTIRCAGYDLGSQTNQVMALFGVVFQQSTLDLDLTIKQNLCYFGALHGLSTKVTLANCQPLLQYFSLEHRLGEKIRQLNGGHRRRVELVRALCHRPKILLLDEASVGLDNDSRQSFLSYVRKLTEQQQLCVVWTTHLLDEVIPSDHLVLLTDGEVAASGEVASLCQQYQVQQVQQLYLKVNQQGAFNGI